MLHPRRKRSADCAEEGLAEETCASSGGLELATMVCSFADQRVGLERDDWLVLIMVRLPFRSAYAAVS
jgi:hypothetical protein